MLILRLIHITAGAFWVGVLLFNAVFLGPAVRAAGPEGGKVMAMLVKRNLTTVMPIIGLSAIIAGIWMYYLNSGGFSASYMRTTVGMAYGTGGVCAIIALLIGATMIAPAITRMGQIGQAMATASPADKEKLGGELQALRGRAGFAGNIGAVFGFAALAIMAVARYL